MDIKYQKRIEEIDKQIEDIKANQKKWSNEEGIGPRRALYANLDIEKLEKEKKMILSGRQERIDHIKKTKEILELLKKRSKFLKKRDYDEEIKGLDKEIERIKMGK